MYRCELFCDNLLCYEYGFYGRIFRIYDFWVYQIEKGYGKYSGPVSVSRCKLRFTFKNLIKCLFHKAELFRKGE